MSPAENDIAELDPSHGGGGRLYAKRRVDLGGGSTLLAFHPGIWREYQGADS